MASYVPRGSYSTFKDYGTGVGIPVEMIAFVTQPTGVFCEFAVPLDAYNQAGAQAINQPLIQGLADDIETLVSQVPCVTGGTFVQDTSPASGQLIDFVRFYLAHTGANGIDVFTSFTDVPVDNFQIANPGIGGYKPPSTQTYTDPTTQVATACAALQSMG